MKIKQEITYTEGIVGNLVNETIHVKDIGIAYVGISDQGYISIGHKSLGLITIELDSLKQFIATLKD